MRKGIVAILAVAIIGVLGIYGESKPGSAHQASPAQNTAVQASQAQPDQTSSAPQTSSSYKDGTYTGREVNTVYGPVQIQAIISGGHIVDVKFVTMPDDLGHTQEVTNESGPLLEQETLAKQSAKIDFVTGATQTSEGYQQSLQSALDQALMS